MSVMSNKNHAPMRNSYTKQPQRPTPSAVRKRRGPAKVAGTMDLNATAMRKALIWVGGLLGVMLLFFILSYGLLQAYRNFTTSEYFFINDIQVNGIQKLTEDDIINLSGIQKGENSFLVHIPQIEEHLLNDPWIESVSIRRELPDKFIIDVKERVAKFLVIKENIIYYLDSDAKIIAPVSQYNFESLPILDIGPGGEEALPLLSKFFAKINNSNIPFDVSQISWLKVSAGKGFEMYWENKQLSFSIDFEDWNRNLRHLGLVIQDLENRKEIDKIRDIRAADGQVWLQKI